MESVKRAIREVLNENLDRWRTEKKEEQDILVMLTELVQKEFGYKLDSDDLEKSIVEVSVEFKPPTVSVSIVNGGIQVVMSKPMSNVEVLGMLEMGKAQLINSMIDEKNKRVMTQN